MALQKCPRCDLNYCRKNEKYCDVCLREMARTGKKKEETEEEEVILCSECGENPALPGHELCLECFKEQRRQQELENINDAENSDDDDFSDSEEDSGD